MGGKENQSFMQIKLGYVFLLIGSGVESKSITDEVVDAQECV